MGLREKPLFRELLFPSASWKGGKEAEDVVEDVKVLREFESALIRIYFCPEIKNIYRLF